MRSFLNIQPPSRPASTSSFLSIISDLKQSFWDLHLRYSFVSFLTTLGKTSRLFLYTTGYTDGINKNKQLARKVKNLFDTNMAKISLKYKNKCYLINLSKIQ